MLETFLELPIPPSGSYSASTVSSGAWRVARSADGTPAVLIELTLETGASTPRRLTHLRYSPPQTVHIIGADGEGRGARAAILECRAPHRALQAYFFRMLPVVLGTHGTTEDELELALDALVRLFRALQQPGLRTVQGLWGELAVIAWSTDPRTAVTSWHSEARALHDFSAGAARLEVKCTSKSVREHTLLLDQLSNVTDTTLLASILVSEDSAGASVHDLVELVAERVDHEREVRRRLEAIVAESLGEAWEESQQVRYDLGQARAELRLYRASDVPSIPLPLPAAIKEVRFTVDFSAVPALDEEAARGLGPWFASLCPGV